MPRPKLSRRAPPKVDAALTAATAIQPPQREATTSSDLYGHSDREHERLRAEQQKRKSTVQAPEPPLRRSMRKQAALGDLEDRRDDALERLAAEAAQTSSSTVAELEKSDSSVELGRREGTTPQQRRDTTGLEIEDTELFGGLDSSFSFGSALKGGRSTDTSSLSISQFKRRSRAPSFSGTEGVIRPSSRGPNTPGISSHFNMRRFRRRAREPSILGRSREENSSQNPSRQASEQPESEDGDGFAPEAESTPLDKPKSRRVALSPAADAPQLSSSGDSRSRKRKTLESAEVSDRLEKASRLESDEDQDQDDLDSESDLSLPSPRSIRPTRQERPVTPVNQDEIMAPPVSSGSEDDHRVMLPDIRNLAKRRRHVSHNTPLHDDNHSDISSPPSLTHSPNFRASKPASKARGRARKLEPTSKVTTADLTALLPRRLHTKGRNDGYEIDSSDDDIDTSGLGQDEDELSYLEGRARRPLSRAASRNRPASREGRSVPRSARAKQVPASRKSMNPTYGRNSDKENQDNEDEDSSLAPLEDSAFDDQNTIEMQAKIGEELTKAVKKFKEVDKWELSFEEVADSPSPSDAR